jgi:uncharacterized membrane protein
VAGDEPVTSPDQRRPLNHKWARIGGIVTIVVLLLMTLDGNRGGYVETYFLLGTALVIALLLVGDWLLRKNGLKSD